MKYAIFGATGSVGKALAVELAKKGSSFRVIGRSKETLQRHFRAYEPFVEYCEADLGDPSAATRAAAGVDTIFYTVGVPYTQFGPASETDKNRARSRGGSPGETFRPRQHRLPLRHSADGPG